MRRTRQTTKAQLQAQEEAELFKEHVPLNICREVERVVEGLWAEVKAMPWEILHVKVADWVLDPSNTVVRASSYEHMLMTYWVMVHLVGHSLAMQEAKR